MFLSQNRLSRGLERAIRNLSDKGKCKVTKTEPDPCDEPCGNLGGLVVGAYETCDGFALTPTASELDKELGGAIMQSLKGARLKLGQASLITNLGSKFNAVAVASLGDEDAKKDPKQNLDEKKENVRIAAAAGTLALERIGVRAIQIEDFCYPQAAAEGASLGIWKYQELRNEKKRKKAVCISMYKSADRKDWDKGLIYACAQNTARLLEEVPPNIMTPFNFGQYAIDILCPLGISVNIRDLKWIQKKDLTAFLKVAQGSCEYPYLLELHYCNGKEGAPPIGFVGQGTTFNSGGVCLKSCNEMRHMGADMAGGAVLVGLFQGAANLGAPQNMTALIPLYENMPGGLALKPGDVIASLSGKTVRLQNTAKEARVVLGDVLAYMCNFNSKQVYNIGSIAHKGMTEALGNSATGLFTNSNSIAKALAAAGSDTGDRVWRLPLWNIFSKRITNSLCCDIQNEAPSKGGDPSVGAAYLKKFLPGSVKQFAHLDVSGTGLLSGGYGKPYLEPQSMSGRPTRTLLEYINTMSSSEQKAC